ncbi:MAG: 50S ribosomal protein L9, partial [Parvularculaceae bacterium]|nr:50S ribosomal protein L9 [Parvularculaceae bacterium]
VELEARNLERRKDAEKVASRLDGQTFVVIRQASESGLLFGSVSTRDIADVATAGGVAVDRTQVRLDKPLKQLGISPIKVMLHPEVTVTISINVARSEEEAERQARGENVLLRVEEKDEDDGADQAEFFDENAAKAVDEAAKA